MTKLGPQSKWRSFIDSFTDPVDEDELWRHYKLAHEFDPSDFSVRPPWCIAGADNNQWARTAFLGAGKRELAWANLGYTDQPFRFSYLWLDLARFNGLLRDGKLPITVTTARAKLRRQAGDLERSFRALRSALIKWPFREHLDLINLLDAKDYSGSVILTEGTRHLSKERLADGAAAMHAGAFKQINLSMTGVLDRAARKLSSWQPPDALIERPNKVGVRPRFATRWLDATLTQLGGTIPSPRRYLLIAELVNILNELGEWGDDPWTDEQVRRCLDGKSRRLRRDSV